jgi:molybdenum cofactor cytidylyltransferase
MITAVVLAAGVSKRMGKPKMLLPWGPKMVIQQVVETLIDSGISDIVVVAGALQSEIREALKDAHINLVVNPLYSNGEMTTSLQEGLSHLPELPTDIMVVLGDQPFIKKQTIRMLIAASNASDKPIVMPSFINRRGHPWIVKNEIWKEIQELTAPETLRDFFHQHENAIEYVLVEDDGIAQDMDTPEDYERLRPKGDVE